MSILYLPGLASAQPTPDVNYQALSRVVLNQLDEIVKLNAKIIADEKEVADLEKQINDLKSAAPASAEPKK